MFKRILYMSILCISMVQAAILTTNKNTYAGNELIKVNFSEMIKQQNDWIAIYKEGTPNTWENVIQWNWTNDIQAGQITFKPLANGKYEVRAFYNNSYVVEASKKFNVGLNITSILTNKNEYTPNESILTTFKNLSGNNKDWLAIYKKGSVSNWENMIQWSWAGNINGQHNFDPLVAGEYEARVFFNNTFNVEATHAFKVSNENPINAIVTTNKIKYTINDPIVASYNNMSGSDKDWIAIYPKGSNNNWENMIQWAWIHGDINGNSNFEKLPVGEYEVRVFFNNSFKSEAVHNFIVVNNEFNVISRKVTYDPFELIHADFVNMRGTASDWLGVFSVGAAHSKASAIQWKYARSLVNGNVSFNGLPVGTYEMRAYFATKHKKTLVFKVQNVAPVSITYETAENGLQQNWITQNRAVEVLNIGVNSQHSIRAFLGNTTYFVFPNNPDKKMRFLELDTRIGTASHIGNFGVKIKTKNGNRRIIFSSYMNHSTNGRNDFSGNALPTDPFTLDGYLHNHPGPTDYYLKTRAGNFVHYKINIEEKLRILEPDNELISISLFTSAGGDFDNIKLVSH